MKLSTISWNTKDATITCVIPQLTVDNVDNGQAVTDRLESDPAPAASRSSTDPGSSSSIASNGGGSGFRLRHSSGVSRTSKGDMDAVDAYELTGCMSLLVRPKIVWKAERQQQRGGELLGELWNPCGAAFLPGDDGLVVAEYDMAVTRNNKICIFDAAGDHRNIIYTSLFAAVATAL